MLKPALFVTVLRQLKEDRTKARLQGRSVWVNAWVVQLSCTGSSYVVFGGGSTKRVAAMRAMEAAVAQGWL